MTVGARSPSEYYIRYLISESGLDDLASIRKSLENVGLDYGGAGYLRRLHEDMQPYPEPYRPADRTHSKTNAWLREQRIYDMWRLTKPVADAMVIVDDLLLRERLHPLLLSNLPPSAILRFLQGHTQSPLNRKSLVAYRHYFWNRSVMSQAEWMDYLEGKTDCHALQAGLTLAPDMVKEHLPHIMGTRGPPTWRGADSIMRVAQIAFSKVLQMEHTPPSVQDSRALKNYMEVMFRADEVMQRSGSAASKTLEAFKSFRMRTNDEKAVDIDELSGGNYSRSGVGTGKDIDN